MIVKAIRKITNSDSEVLSVTSVFAAVASSGDNDAQITRESSPTLFNPLSN